MSQKCSLVCDGCGQVLEGGNDEYIGEVRCDAINRGWQQEEYLVIDDLNGEEFVLGDFCIKCTVKVAKLKGNDKERAQAVAEMVNRGKNKDGVAKHDTVTSNMCIICNSNALVDGLRCAYCSSHVGEGSSDLSRKMNILEQRLSKLIIECNSI